MSKITKALEKAARERLQRQKERATVKAGSVEVQLESSIAAPLGAAMQDKIQVDPHIVGATEPSSPIAEQYRILRTKLQSLRLRQNGAGQALIITSAVHGEGKSVTALNLSLTMARQENWRVVLVDADLRKGSIHTWLGLDQNRGGLSSVLARGGEVNGELLWLKEPPLTVLPTGPYPDHPAELLESSSWKRLLATLKSQFDLVIIDAPPLLPVADPGILASQGDSVLLIVRAGKTQRKTVAQAQELLQRAKAKILGCVLTHVEYYLPGYYRYYHQYRYAKKQPKETETSQVVVNG
ncbi:MAG: CpsD/CapB family tyrosine-protein kinase [Candidatus Omnitrophica bacterium]|nr:CpsD/CapB family tyrosine-protein kinase [Candidatus Omnitrophota bacterium]